MTNDADDPVYDPLSRQTYEIIAYNAVGRGSEINGFPIYRLTHSTGRSGWSVGCMQWDFGQPGRQHKVGDLLSGYQSWAPENTRFTATEITSLSARLRTPGQHGNTLSNDELLRLNDYLRSDPGRDFVSGLDREQISYKWENVGQPLSQISWLQELSRTDPRQAAEIVTMTSKRFNQGEVRGRQLLRLLEANEMSSDDVSTWIEDVSIRGASDPDAIISGRDNALAAVRLISDLELGDGRLSEAWREELHINGNVGLTRGFNGNPDVQLFDGMMRNPPAGAHISAHINEGAPAQAALISGSNQYARLEMSHITQDRNGAVTIQSPTGDLFEMTRDGWNRNGIPMQVELGPRRQPDWLDLMERDGTPFAPRSERGNLPDPESMEHFPRNRARPTHTYERHSHVNPEDSTHQRSTQDPRDRNHPDHAMHEGVRAKLRDLYAEQGLSIDSEKLDRLTAGVMADARRSQMTRVDLLEFSEDYDTGKVDVNGNIIAFQGDPANPASPYSATTIDQAMRTPAEDSYRQFDTATQQQTQQWDRFLAQEQELSQSRGMHHSL